jgi:DNA-binding MarR family transcriptional regulator
MTKIDFRTVCDPTNPNFKLETSPFYLMAHTDFKYHLDVSAVLSKHGVTKTMYRVLTVLREYEPANIGFIADAAVTKRTTVSRVIERMVQMGLASTSAGEDDNRVTEVCLTQGGHDLLATLTPVVGRQFLRAMVGVSNSELAQLISTLQKISSNLDKLAIE